MIFTKLSWRNLFSYGDYHTEFALDTDGITFVKGRNKDTGGTNGSGKSVLIDVFSWVLFGKTVKDIPVDAVRCIHTKEAAHACIEFWQGQDYYEINRYRGHKEFGNGVVVKKNGVVDTSVTDGTNKDAQEVIDTILGIDYHALTSSIVFSTEMPLKLPKLTADRRRQFMEMLLGLRAYSEYGKVSKTKAKSIRKGLDEIVVEEREKKNALASQKDDLVKYNGMSKDFNNNKSIALDRLAKQYDDLTSKIDSIDIAKINELKDKISASEIEYKSTEKVITELDLSLQQIDHDIKTIQSSIAETQRSLTTHTKSIEKDFQAQIKLHKQRIDLMKHECPTCQRGWEGIDVEEHNATHNAEITRLTSELNTALRSNQAEYQLIIDGHTESQTAKTKAKSEMSATKTELTKKYKALLTSLSELSEALKAMPKESDLVVLNEQREHLQKTIESKSEEQNPYKKIIDDLSVKIKAAIDILDAVAIKKTALEEDLKYVSFWDESFNNDGLKLFIFETIIPILNNRIAHYLPILFENNKVRCEFDKMMNMFVFLDDVTTSYGNLSQGERKRVDLAIALALLETAQSQHGMSSNVMFFDEIFDSSLDSKAVEIVTKLLYTMPASTIFVISHRSEMTNTFEKTITIEKKNGFSRVSENP